jgi:predicted transcriptional regulator
MSTQVSFTLADEIYRQLDDLARLLNQNSAAVISDIINGVFKGVTEKLNARDIEVALSNEQTVSVQRVEGSGS